MSPPPHHIHHWITVTTAQQSLLHQIHHFITLITTATQSSLHHEHHCYHCNHYSTSPLSLHHSNHCAIAITTYQKLTNWDTANKTVANVYEIAVFCNKKKDLLKLWNVCDFIFLYLQYVLSIKHRGRIKVCDSNKNLHHSHHCITVITASQTSLHHCMTVIITSQSSLHHITVRTVITVIKITTDTSQSSSKIYSRICNIYRQIQRQKTY